MIMVNRNMIHTGDLLEAIRGISYTEDFKLEELVKSEDEADEFANRTVLGIIQKAREKMPELNVSSVEYAVSCFLSGETHKPDIILAGFSERDNDCYRPVIEIGYFDEAKGEKFDSYLREEYRLKW